ncbi:MAG: hypothetical protein LBS57_00140 [Treponema sp.]|jgi:hypothetical protein|nr:hypothetical protein [Treponema sp.]
MNEILIPEAIVAFFIILALLGPFFKKISAIAGFVWLPLVALFITIGIFPAYGFRPECIPLLIYEIIFNVLNIPLLISGAAARSNDDFSDRGLAFTIPALALFSAAALLMFVFSPRIPTGLTSEGIRTEKITNETQNRDYILRIYAPAGVSNNAEQSFIFIAPPEAGALSAVDGICAKLRDRGFTVISYFRRGILPPAPGQGDGMPFPALVGASGPVSPGALYRRWKAFRQGTILKKANEQGQALEREQRQDLEFVIAQLRRISAAAPENGRLLSPPERPLVLAGFGASGSALVSLAESPDFASRFGNIPGIIAVESRLWSAYRSDPPVFSPAQENASWFLRFRTGAANWFAGLRARRTSGFGHLPSPSVPVLYLVSDPAPEEGPMPQSFDPYGAVFEALRNSSGPAALAALEGAGPLDYCDYPLSHPLYSFLFPGRNRKAKSANPQEDAVSLIGNFTAMLLEEERAAALRRQAETAAAREAPRPFIPARQSLGAGVRIETRSWNLPDLRYILAP